jgi:misacylated tRNA(Ala) deacylase
VRLVSIGLDDGVDLQPCGGTHVRSTAEIGGLMVSKIEKKGRQNRRVRLAFAEGR